MGATVDDLPLVMMTPRDALVAQQRGRRFLPDEMVMLAIGWVGARWYSPSLCELAASGWDEPGVPTLWESAFGELGVTPPDPVTDPVPDPVTVVVPAPRPAPEVRTPSDVLVPAAVLT